VRHKQNVLVTSLIRVSLTVLLPHCSELETLMMLRSYYAKHKKHNIMNMLKICSRKILVLEDLKYSIFGILLWLPK
jgi:predicted transposase YdaD